MTCGFVTLNVKDAGDVFVFDLRYVWFSRDDRNSLNFDLINLNSSSNWLMENNVGEYVS